MLLRERDAQVHDALYVVSFQICADRDVLYIY